MGDTPNYLNVGALTCPFCEGLLQEDDAGLVSCQDCLKEWKMFKGQLAQVDDYDDEANDAGKRTRRKANGRKMKVDGRSVFLHTRLRRERDERLLEKDNGG